MRDFCGHRTELYVHSFDAARPNPHAMRPVDPLHEPCAACGDILVELRLAHGEKGHTVTFTELMHMFAQRFSAGVDDLSFAASRP